jgi:predicted nucleic acid-binding protein
VSRYVLVDANVLLDVATDDPERAERSGAALARVANETALAINPIVYAEVSVGYDRIEDLDAALPPETFVRLPLPWAAGFLAGKCFVRYRKAGGMRRSPLPDFYIGAHAALEGFPLLTRDTRRYRTYFPRLQLVTP